MIHRRCMVYRPATIRNDLAFLEKQGIVCAPWWRVDLP
ncbi:hypothetical protein ACNKHM_16560 [Shigella sonnei]